MEQLELDERTPWGEPDRIKFIAIPQSGALLPLGIEARVCRHLMSIVGRAMAGFSPYES